jgi:hypothetical protein
VVDVYYILFLLSIKRVCRCLSSQVCEEVSSDDQFFSIYLCLVVSDLDQLQPLDSNPTPLTRDFVGLCIGILSVVLVIFTVAICKWSRCRCLKRSNDNNVPNEVFSSILQQNTSTSHPHSQRYQNLNQHSQRPSSCDHRPGNVYRHISNGRNEIISPAQPVNNGYRLNDVKAPRVTITTLAVQPSQQLVPRLSTSPQVSGSSIGRSTYSLKQ